MAIRQRSGARFPYPVARAALAAAVAVMLAACGAGSDSAENGAATPKTSASPTPKGVLTVKSAESVLNKYEKVNNRANASRDEELLATVESGQVNEQSAADYEQWETWSKEDQDLYGSPFVYSNRTYLRPAAGTATWFAVAASSTSGSKERALMIFDKVGGSFKLVAAVYEDETPIPEIKVDGYGLAEAVDPSAQVGSLAPEDISPAFEDLYETGGKASGSELARTQAKQDAVKAFNDRNAGDSSKEATFAYFYTEPAHPKVYALRTANGGVLAVVPTAHTTEFILKSQYRSSFEINPNETEALYDPTSRDVITNEHQGQALAVLTTSGKPAVIAREYRLVDSR